MANTTELYLQQGKLRRHEHARFDIWNEKSDQIEKEYTDEVGGNIRKLFYELVVVDENKGPFCAANFKIDREADVISFHYCSPKYNLTTLSRVGPPKMQIIFANANGDLDRKVMRPEATTCRFIVDIPTVNGQRPTRFSVFTGKYYLCKRRFDFQNYNGEKQMDSSRGNYLKYMVSPFDRAFLDFMQTMTEEDTAKDNGYFFAHNKDLTKKTAKPGITLKQGRRSRKPSPDFPRWKFPGSSDSEELEEKEELSRDLPIAKRGLKSIADSTPQDRNKEEIERSVDSKNVPIPGKNPEKVASLGKPN